MSVLDFKSEVFFVVGGLFFFFLKNKPAIWIYILLANIWELKL